MFILIYWHIWYVSLAGPNLVPPHPLLTWLSWDSSFWLTHFVSSHTGSDDLVLISFICSAPFSSIQFIAKVLNWLTYFELLSCAKKYLENFVIIFLNCFSLLKTIIVHYEKYRPKHNYRRTVAHHSSLKRVSPHFLDENSWRSARLTDLLESRTGVWRSVQGLFSGSFKYFF